MQRTAIAITLMFLAGMAHAQVASNCGSLAAPQALAIRPTVIAPIAPEMLAPSHQLGAPTGVLSQAFDESLSVDQVLFRMKIEGCQNVATVTPASIPGTLPASVPTSALPVSTTATIPAPTAIPASTDPAAYKPKTEFDNTPWRFDMSQNGKRMTADEFSAWMKAKGVRVAKGAPAAMTVSSDAASIVPANVAPAPTVLPGTTAPAAATPVTATPTIPSPVPISPALPIEPAGDKVEDSGQGDE